MQPPADGDSELFCMHEPDVPLLNKVFERKTPSAILPGHADGQPQVVLHEPPAGLTVAGLGPAAKVYLLRVAEQTSPAAYARHVGRKDSGRFRLLADSRISSKGSSLWCDLCVVVWTSNM
jgi:hypothetical protein